MPYVPVPKDLTTIKTKVAFNLTKRQLICFGGAAAVGSGAVMALVAAALPFFFFAMYEKNGQPLEKILKNFYNTRFKRPKVRPYQTNNLYAALERQSKLDKEVNIIVKSEHRKK